VIEVSSGLDLDVEIVATLKSNASNSDSDVYIKVKPGLKPGLKPTEEEDIVIGGDQDSDDYSSIISDLT
jgi:hypothetical protein